MMYMDPVSLRSYITKRIMILCFIFDTANIRRTLNERKKIVFLYVNKVCVSVMESSSRSFMKPKMEIGLDDFMFI